MSSMRGQLSSAVSPSQQATIESGY